MTWLNPGSWLLYLALIAAAVVGYKAWETHQQAIGEQRAVDRYERAIEQQQAKAARVLAVEKAKVLARERELQIVYTTQEATDAKNRTTVEGLRTRVQRLLADSLQQPTQDAGAGRGGSSACPASAPAAAANHRPADPAQTSGLVPGRTAADLAALTLEADRINIAYASCRASLMARATAQETGDGAP